MELAGENADVIGAAAQFFLQQRHGVLEVFRGGGGLVFHKDPVRGDAGFRQTVVHALGLGDVFIIGLATGDHGDHIGVFLHVFCGGLDAVTQHGGGFCAFYGGAQDDQIGKIAFGAQTSEQDQRAGDQRRQQRDQQQRDSQLKDDFNGSIEDAELPITTSEPDDDYEVEEEETEEDFDENFDENFDEDMLEGDDY